MKKIIAFVLAVILSATLCTYVSAGNVESNYTYGNVEIVFDENSTLTAEMKQGIVEYIINGDDSASTYNLICTILGHNETIECVTTISHKVRTTDPRCLRQNWEIHACTRCEEVLEQIELSRSYITCCPEE